MKTVIRALALLVLSGCGRDDGLRPLDEHVFKEYPVCQVVKEGVACREEDQLFPLGWGERYHYYYKDKLYRPS